MPSVSPDQRFLGVKTAIHIPEQIRSELTTPGSRTRELATQVLENRYRPNGLAAPDTPTREAFYRSLERFRGELAAAATPRRRRRVNYWRQVVRSSLGSYAEMVWYYREHGFDDPEWTGFNLRDKQNAENLLWLANEEYRGKKVIVWGATMHLLRQAASIEATVDPKTPRRSYRTTVPMGELVWRRLGQQMFSIGFTSYEGVNGIGAADDPQGFRSPIVEDQDPSIELEELFNASRFDYALVGFRRVARGGEWLRQPILSRSLGNQAMRAVWPNVLDAMFFIRRMEPNLATRPGR